jgi:acyl dehydratase
MRFEDFTIGQTFSAEPVQVHQGDILDFAHKFDPSYLHMDQEKSKHTLFGGIIASGLFTISTAWGQFVRQNVLGDDFLGGMDVNIHWTLPVYPEDTLFSEVEVYRKSETTEPTSGMLTLQLNVFNQKQEKVAVARVKVLVRKLEHAVCVAV